MKTIKSIFESFFDLVESIVVFIGVVLIVLACTAFLWLPWVLLLLR